MADVLYRNELVSKEWATVLTDMAKDGVDFSINEARRTYARQQYFWNCYQCQCCNNGNLAARPSPWAPHIRVGRIDHAIDFANPDAVVRWLAGKGLQPTRPVPGESWHVEVPGWALTKYHKAHSQTIYDVLPRHVGRAVKRFIGARNNVRDKLKDRDRVDSKAQPARWEARDEAVRDAMKVRSKRRGRLERMLKRSRNDRTRRVLRRVLDT